MSAIGGRVRELRLARGMSQQALAGDGISPGYVSLIESGKRTPSRETAERLASRLGVTVEDLLEAAVPTVSEEARVEINFARLALANGDPHEAIRGLARVEPSALDNEAACEASMVLAHAYRETGQLEVALDLLENLAERCRREGAWLALAHVATALVVMSIEAGDVARAGDVAHAALAEVEAAGLVGTDEHLRLASVEVSSLFERGDLVHAARRVEDLIRVADRLGSARARGAIYWTAGTVAHERGRVADALRLTDRAVALLGEQEASRDLPRLRMNYAWMLLTHESPRAAEALEQLDKAASDSTIAGSRLDLGVLATYSSRAHLLLGDVDAAAEQAAQALQLLGPSEHTERATALILLGDVGTAQFDMDLAQEAFGEAEVTLSAMTPNRAVARLWRELGDGLRDLGETDRALTAYDRSFKILGLAPRPTPVGERALDGHQRSIAR
jgi:transcriptional regulator with XRE-family HTH domain